MRHFPEELATVVATAISKDLNVLYDKGNSVNSSELPSGTLASKNIFQYMTRSYILSGKKGGVVLVVMLEDYY